MRHGSEAVSEPVGEKNWLRSRSALRRLHLPVRPAHFETPSWYLRRLCATNFVDGVWMAGVVRARRRTMSDATALAQVIAELGGPGVGHWEPSHHRASQGMLSPRGTFDKQGSNRLACRSCTAGQDVVTYDHIRFGLCLRHGRWVGPGVTPTTQRLVRLTPELVAAEKVMRRLVTSGLVDADLYETAWHLTRDHAYLSGDHPKRLEEAMGRDDFQRGVDDRLALYPRTARLLRDVTTPTFAALATQDFRSATTRRAYLHRALDWLAHDRWIVAEGIEEWVEDRFDQKTTGGVRDAA